MASGKDKVPFLMWHAAGLGDPWRAADSPSHATPVYSSPTPLARWGLACFETHLLSPCRDWAMWWQIAAGAVARASLVPARTLTHCSGLGVGAAVPGTAGSMGTARRDKKVFFWLIFYAIRAFSSGKAQSLPLSRLLLKVRAKIPRGVRKADNPRSS